MSGFGSVSPQPPRFTDWYLLVIWQMHLYMTQQETQRLETAVWKQRLE